MYLPHLFLQSFHFPRAHNSALPRGETSISQLPFEVIPHAKMDLTNYDIHGMPRKVTPFSTARSRRMKPLMTKLGSVIIGLVGASILFGGGTNSSLYRYARSLFCEDITFQYVNEPYGYWNELYVNSVDYFRSELVVRDGPRDNELVFLVPFLHCSDR